MVNAMLKVEAKHRRHSCALHCRFSGAERLGVDGDAQSPCGLFPAWWWLYCRDPVRHWRLCCRTLFCAIATGYLDDNCHVKRDIPLWALSFRDVWRQGWCAHVAIQSEVLSTIFCLAICWGFPPTILGKRRRFCSDCADYRAKVARLSATPSIHLRLKPADYAATCCCYGLLCMIALTIVATLKAVRIILSHRC